MSGRTHNVFGLRPQGGDPLTEEDPLAQEEAYLLNQARYVEAEAL
jgi:hypothetical protein